MERQSIDFKHFYNTINLYFNSVFHKLFEVFLYICVCIEGLWKKTYKPFSMAA